MSNYKVGYFVGSLCRVDLSQSTTASPRIDREPTTRCAPATCFAVRRRHAVTRRHLHVVVHLEPLASAREHRQCRHGDLRAPQDIPER